ncbi:MAG: iron-containing alcohol dehydrogenase [bacterium]|nr:iron-containing alcohol dehydrogenase [bacterium]
MNGDLRRAGPDTIFATDSFDFIAPGAVRFGIGRVSELGQEASRLGRSVLLVSGAPESAESAAVESLTGSGLRVSVFRVSSEPSVPAVMEAVRLAKESDCDAAAGIGGGSAMDCAKAAAALAVHPADPLDYLEVVGRGRPLERPGLPVIAVPTTAGTGAEATFNAVLHSPEHRVKVSLRSPTMMPRVAIVDPGLTLSCPPPVTAASGLDALTQLIEPFTCVRPQALVDGLCREGMRRAAASLRRAFEDGRDITARLDMSIAALFSGMALANARLGAVHGIAAPLGGLTSAPHGAACARLLPETMAVNIRLLRKGRDAAGSLERYTETARILTGDPSAEAEAGTEWARGLVESFRIPRLSAWGLSPSDFPAVAEKAGRANSMKGNPVSLGPEEITEILTRAL